MFRDNLSSLDAYMSSVNSNVKKFNEYVRLNYEGLKSHGERCDNIMENLFQFYCAASDH